MLLSTMMFSALSRCEFRIQDSGTYPRLIFNCGGPLFSNCRNFMLEIHSFKDYWFWRQKRRIQFKLVLKLPSDIWKCSCARLILHYLVVEIATFYMIQAAWYFDVYLKKLVDISRLFSRLGRSQLALLDFTPLFMLANNLICKMAQKFRVAHRPSWYKQ